MWLPARRSGPLGGTRSPPSKRQLNQCVMGGLRTPTNNANQGSNRRSLTASSMLVDLAGVVPDDPPDPWKERGRKQQLDRVADHERVQPPLEPLGERHVERGKEPGDAGRVDDDVTEQHRAYRAPHAAVPTSPRQPTDERAGQQEPPQVPAGRRPETEQGESGPALRVEGQPDRTL